MAQKHKLQLLLRPLLFPLSGIYAAAALLRKKLYRNGVLKSYTSPLFCLCAGNVSWGGTGKSPVIDWLLKYFAEKNIKTCVLSRGYGTKLPYSPFLLDKNTDRHILPLPDEPCMLLKKNPNAVFMLGSDRAASARAAEKIPETKVLLMDDGFQHFGLNRNLDLILLDKDDLYPKTSENTTCNNWNEVIPLGSWRESENALRRASAFLIKCPPAEWEKLEPFAKEKLLPYNKPIFTFYIKITKLIPLFENSAVQDFSDYALLAGIGNPKQFEESAENFLNRPCSRKFFLADHASMQDMEQILLSLNVPLICTEKDAVKLEQIRSLKTKQIYYTETSAVFYGNGTAETTFKLWADKNILPHIR